MFSTRVPFDFIDFTVTDFVLFGLGHELPLRRNFDMASLMIPGE